ncbi:ribonuclease E/G [Sphingomonas naphthae]|uniref:Ribonuclease E n=1 Tax=Sphingomonas naphthae TaxID=1813468 RepID=A0ABY7THJ9_9SPHN|nr:ribonuclease E/G [Sphingomonas naphthae]WCT72353.1 ribonuclease E/G [Sphingomonas naphthae]
MTTRMLIDARHREETRVAVVKGNRIEEFDFDSEERKQLKGNIYLARVTRVEPSLQAAFIEYGGNRHGFLAFSEIHPDYYQIPKEDREALLREEAEHAAEEEALRAAEDDRDDADEEIEEEVALERFEDDGGAEGDGDDHGDLPPPPRRSAGGGDDQAVESLRQRRMSLRRRYKIQDVIRRRQVLLVQIVKEERGNKGAALTTYLSLAGRYCVLMPNTAHGGGISRKISNSGDRKRLKSILADLNLPKTMGCIVRTAGLQRTKVEIKRDFDYLARLWDEIREKTLTSEAPALVYGDSDLIKRAIRDIYNKDIDEVIVEGEEGYRSARNFMKLLMPSHAKKIVPYVDAVPLYQRFGVEEQLSAMYQPVVQLKSGGYIVINPTEALVSIDINSGRSTREHNIEQTATATNLEAAHEIARQLRLRDMAGLVVIDFIDMENGSNNRKVEKAMKEALKNDRARIQVGRISSFGLFEMSRQRIRTGVLEASTRGCPHCEGTGLVRTASSSALSALRMLEEEAARGRGSRLLLRASQEAALYVLNRKRAELAEIEDRYGVFIEIIGDGAMEGARMTVEAGGPPPAYAPRLPQPIVIEADDDFIEEDEIEEEEIEETEEAEGERPARAERGDRGGERGEDGRGGGRRRRRRRRRGGGRDEAPEGASGDVESVEGEPIEAEAIETDAETVEAPEAGAGDSAEGGRGGRRGRRGRRGGRRRGGDEAGVSQPAAAEGETGLEEAPAPIVEAPVAEEAAAPVEEEASRPRRRPRARKAAAEVAEPVIAAEPEAPAPEPVVEAEAEAPKPKARRSRKKTVEPVEVAPEAAVEAAPVEAEPGIEAAEPAPAKPRRGRKPKAAPVEAEAEATPNVVGVPVEAQPAEEALAAEPVATDTETAAPATAEDGSGEPPRRGWWQRTFGA